MYHIKQSNGYEINETYCLVANLSVAAIMNVIMRGM